jgi:hypothetical protein
MPKSTYSRDELLARLAKTLAATTPVMLLAAGCATADYGGGQKASAEAVSEAEAEGYGEAEGEAEAEGYGEAESEAEGEAEAEGYGEAESEAEGEAEAEGA